MREEMDLRELSIAVADDHQRMLEGIRTLLAKKGIRDVTLFRTARELMAYLRTRAFHIYIIDVELPDMDGFTLIDAIRRERPQARIIVNTIHDELWTVCRLVAARVDGILFKTLDASALPDALRAVADGRTYYCEEVGEALRMVEDKGIEHPSLREMEVLHAIADGRVSREIADSLCISENTVEAHRKNLFAKLGVRNIADLIVKAGRRGYLGWRKANH